MAADDFDDVTTETPAAAEGPRRGRPPNAAKAAAVDRFGRTFNPRIHEGATAVDAEGFLKVKRRDQKRAPLGTTLELTEVLDQHKQDGYEYRWVNRKPGRVAKFESHDWEPVMDKSNGQVALAVNPVTGTLSGAADAVLMRKPKEWFDADRAAKAEATRVDFQQKSKPTGDAAEFYSGLKPERDPRVQ